MLERKFSNYHKKFLLKMTFFRKKGNCVKFTRIQCLFLTALDNISKLTPSDYKKVTQNKMHTVIETKQQTHMQTMLREH